MRPSAFATAAAILSVASASASDEPTRAETVPCPFDVPAGRHADCYFVIRPLGGGSDSDLEARLFTVVFRAREPGAPLVYLDGGPGGSSFLMPDQIETWWWLLDTYPFLAQRDLVVFAQRGSPPSETSIDCPAFKAAVTRLLALGADHRGTAEDTRLEAIVACVAALHDQGIELDAFTTPHRAADVPALLGALGYESWHLWGVSYGTHLALSVLRDHPEGTRSLILESVMTPNVAADLVPDDRSQFRRLLFDACAEDALCARRFPDLPAAFERVVRRLDDSPLAWTSDDGRADALVLDGDVLGEIIEITAYYGTLGRYVPAMIGAADGGDFDLLSSIAGIEVGYEREDGMASLALDARWCAEVWPFLDPALASVADIHELRHDIVPDGAAYCQAIGVDPLGPQSLVAATSEVPVLLLAGTMDPVTPPAWAHAAARTLANATVIEFPGRAHAFAFEDACAMAAMQGFLDDSATASVTPCLATLAPPPFEIEP
ncbi:MAG: alpha/beta fold hydrolase [Alphaproteobacteria bacterium]